MSEIINQINQLSEERFNLYRLAGKQHLTAEQHDWLNAITNQLPVLWDQYRRETAADQRIASPNARRSAA